MRLRRFVNDYVKWVTNLRLKIARLFVTLFKPSQNVCTMSMVS